MFFCVDCGKIGEILSKDQCFFDKSYGKIAKVNKLNPVNVYKCPYCESKNVLSDMLNQYYMEEEVTNDLQDFTEEEVEAANVETLREEEPKEEEEEEEIKLPVVERKVRPKPKLNKYKCNRCNAFFETKSNFGQGGFATCRDCLLKMVDR